MRIFGAKIQLQKIRKNRGKNSWFWSILARKFKFNLVILYIILGAKIQTFKANKYGGTRTTPMSKFLTFEQKKSVGNKRKCCVVSLVKKSFFFLSRKLAKWKTTELYWLPSDLRILTRPAHSGQKSPFCLFMHSK